MHVPEAINLFLQAASDAGLAASNGKAPEDLGSSVTSVGGTGAELRVVWDGRDEYLSVQVSHGPVSASPAGWLTLYGSKCAAALLPDPPSPEESFPSAVEYGLELMSPGASSRNDA